VDLPNPLGYVPIEKDPERSVKRRYDSPTRDAAAKATRLRILDAAHEVLTERGYAGTTVRAIADRADVSVKTVEATFGTKVNLFKTLVDVRIAGDDEPVAISDRPVVAEMVAEPDPVRMLEMNAAFMADINRRLYVVNRIAHAAGPELEEFLVVSRAQRREGAAAMVGILATKAPLRVDADEAIDTVWVLMDPFNYDQATNHLGWSHDRYVGWLFDASVRLLLETPADEDPGWS
jgi:TetR/AcrR family transcriptional regulator of autoinduction and epiphytic fitness